MSALRTALREALQPRTVEQQLVWQGSPTGTLTARGKGKAKWEIVWNERDKAYRAYSYDASGQRRFLGFYGKDELKRAQYGASVTARKHGLFPQSEAVQLRAREAETLRDKYLRIAKSMGLTKNLGSLVMNINRSWSGNMMSDANVKKAVLNWQRRTAKAKARSKARSGKPTWPQPESRR